MESESTLVWADGIVELNTVSTVNLDFPIVIFPLYLECEDPIRLYDPIEDLVLEIDRI